MQRRRGRQRLRLDTSHYDDSHLEHYCRLITEATTIHIPAFKKCSVSSPRLRARDGSLHHSCHSNQRSPVASEVPQSIPRPACWFSSLCGLGCCRPAQAVQSAHVASLICAPFAANFANYSTFQVTTNARPQAPSAMAMSTFLYHEDETLGDIKVSCVLPEIHRA